MGLDVYAKLVVGLPSNKVLREETKTNWVKKFNEDTGEPYMRPVYEKVVIIFDSEFPKTDDFILCECLTTLHPELQCFRFDSENYVDLDIDRVIGFEVCKMGGRCENGTRKPVTQQEIDSAMERFELTFKKKPQLFLTMEYSY